MSRGSHDKKRMSVKPESGFWGKGVGGEKVLFVKHGSNRWYLFVRIKMVYRPLLPMKHFKRFLLMQEQGYTV